MWQVPRGARAWRWRSSARRWRLRSACKASGEERHRPICCLGPVTENGLTRSSLARCVEKPPRCQAKGREAKPAAESMPGRTRGELVCPVGSDG